MQAKQSIRASRQTGFTLVELLIVVIILAILAAIVVPQFTASTDEAREAGIDSTLANMRATLDLYRQQHGEYPADGEAVADQAAATMAFWDQLTLFTDDTGATSATKDPTNFPYGPYLHKASLPTVEGSSTIVISDSAVIPLDVSAGTGGWIYSWETGQFMVNHPSYANR